ncbi:MAG: ATP-binding protein [Candidatus Omnitrophota bacterium]|nr:ATP-binding protein [Candidatus Omnitrophota bacterium]
MRLYSEKCLRNLQDRMIVFGFEGWDIFMVLGAALILQIVKVNSLVIWGICGVMSGFLILVKRGKPANASEHYMDWFFKDKRFTAFPQAFAHNIRGRELDLRLNGLQEILPYSHFEDGFLVFKDDSLSVGYAITCPSLDNLSSDELIGYSQKIETFLNGLSDRATYQVFFTLDSDYHKEIDEHKVIKTNHPLIKTMHAQRIERFEALTKERLFRRRQCYLLVNFAQVHLGGRPRPFNFFGSIKKLTAAQVDETKKDFRLVLNNIEEGINGAGLGCKPMDDYGLMCLMYKYLNPDRLKEGIECPRPKDEEAFVKQVCCSDLAIDEKKGEYIHFGGFYHKYISLKVLPEATFPAMLARLDHLSFPEFDLVVNFEAPEKEWGRTRIESMRKREYGNMQGMFGIINKDAQTKVSQYEYLLEEIQQSNQKLFRMQLTVHVYAAEFEEVKKKTAEVIRLFSSLNGTEMHDERWGAVKPVFVSILPGWTKEASRWVLLKSAHLADFMPFFSEFKGSGKAECLFYNTTHGLAAYDPFSDDLSAFNTVVVGASGSGKSFTINQIINQYSKNDPVEIFIDIGGSYKRQVILKGGEYIDLGLKEKFTINLFDLSAGKKLCDFNEEEQNEILIIKTKTIEQMMGGVARFNGSDQIVEDYIFRSIQRLYRAVEYPVLSDLKGALKATCEAHKTLQQFYEPVVGLLGNWFAGGQYGNYTDGKSTISLDKSVICFDLKGLEKFERLQAVMLTIVTNFVWGKIMSEPGRRKFVIFDECWKLLSTPESAKFIAECYRTFRKYGAAAISVTQSLNDFLSGGLEHAILGNSNTRFILRQNSMPAVKGIVDYFNFNEQEQRLIETLQIKKGEYSEVFFSQSKQLQHISAKMVICPTPIEYWVATTDAMDLNYYEKIKIKGPALNMYEVLQQCAKDFPRGVGYEKTNY